MTNIDLTNIVNIIVNMKRFLSRLTQKDKKNDTLIISKADGVFNKYQKTFKDLARYDRGEKILSN